MSWEECAALHIMRRGWKDDGWLGVHDSFMKAMYVENTNGSREACQSGRQVQTRNCRYRGAGKTPQ